MSEDISRGVVLEGHVNTSLDYIGWFRVPTETEPQLYGTMRKIDESNPDRYSITAAAYRKVDLLFHGQLQGHRFAVRRFPHLALETPPLSTASLA